MSTEYTSAIKRFCSVYKSPKKGEMYIYLDRSKGLASFPENLKAAFGEPEHVLDMVLTPEKKLARVEATKVLEEIASKGFYLQMPPAENNEIVGEYNLPKDTLNG